MVPTAFLYPSDANNFLRTRFPTLLSDLPCPDLRNRPPVSHFIFSESERPALEISSLAPVSVSNIVIRVQGDRRLHPSRVRRAGQSGTSPSLAARPPKSVPRVRSVRVRRHRQTADVPAPNNRSLGVNGETVHVERRPPPPMSFRYPQCPSTRPRGSALAARPAIVICEALDHLFSQIADCHLRIDGHFTRFKCRLPL